MAVRLGFTDVDELVEKLPPRKLNRWLAHAELAGWDREPERHAELMAKLNNATLDAAIVSRGGEVKKEDFRDKYDYVRPYPWGPQKPEPVVNELTAEQFAAAAKMIVS